MIIALRKLRIEGMSFNIIKVIIDKSIANIIFNEEKLKSFSYKVRNETRVPTLPTPIQHRTRILSHNNKAIRINKRH
jgi:c-di-GMP-binding flagellar brake protein YcgR